MVKKIIYIIVGLLLSCAAFSDNEYYNVTDFGNQTTYADMLVKFNDYTGGWYGTGFLVGFFIITLIFARKYTMEFKSALAVSSFVSGIVGILLIPLNIIKLEGILLIIVLFAACFAAIVWD